VTVLLLVRHAVTDATGKRLYGRSPGVRLSGRGAEQAAAVARRLASIRVEAIYASPLERCRETAAPIAQTLGVEVHDEPGLLETDTGRWTGRTFAQIRRASLWRRIHSMPSMARFPDGEALSEVQARTVRALEEIATRHPRGTVVVVSHGDPIRLALAHYGGVHLDHFQRLEVFPASISAVALGRGEPRILLLNDTGALTELLPRGTSRR
jgi:probable phosphomutase (TIGR03848 family)